MRVVVCGDVGSTYTKVAAVDVDSGALLGTAAHPTTIATDVLDGLYAARDVVLSGVGDGVVVEELRVCSSAGGGLTCAVVGNEPLVTATAAHRAALSAGARIVGVAAGVLSDADFEVLAGSVPDTVLFAGGTDGGDASVLLEHARQYASAVGRDGRLRVPVVLAANARAAGEVEAILRGAGLPVQVVGNVLPRIGMLRPQEARGALREAFLRHVIAGKHLSAGEEFTRLVRAATPDAVLSGVELLADGFEDVPGRGDLLLVDVGGATTDVYSVLTPDAELEGPRAEVAGSQWRSRTVEGDLGVRWNAPGIVEAAAAERLLDTEGVSRLEGPAAARAAVPGFLPDDEAGARVDVELAGLAMKVALRRHARGERLDGLDGPFRGGKDLRGVGLVIGSGGVLRHAAGNAGRDVLAEAVADRSGGWPLPEGAGVVVDVRYVLAAAGLLAQSHPVAALGLLWRELQARRGPFFG
ncbi:glutamate mutase L [Phytomonospora endophytica]|uniref:glutamate mutase L n=1 Tax=Phytomonospora endophytica TaxID=714109 RepID=UPI00161C01DB|nr:glutamate mutase L [Phytomonospora endophytica]